MVETRFRSKIHQREWSELSAAERCRVVGRTRREIAERVDEFVACMRSAQRVDDEETISAEIIPLCEGLRWLESNGPRVLTGRRLGWWGRPMWLWGVRSRVERIPRGDILVLGTWNYPLLLPGIQCAQGLAAGNRLHWKPAPGTEKITQMLADCFYTSGVPRSALSVLDSSVSAASDAMERGVDFVVLTGSNSTGRKVAAKAAERVVPCLLELSGCDACIVLQGADMQRVVAALRFGLMLNSGATCIGPRRILVQRSQRESLEELLGNELGQWGEVQIHPAARNGIIQEVNAALRDGACDLAGTWNEQNFREQGIMRPLVLSRVTRDQSIAHADLFGPLAMLMEVEDETEAIELVNDCRYGLAASLFGPHWEAERIAKQLRVGTVIINDIIVPTADPRLPFGGVRQSGYGVSRGPEGLLEMTQPRVVCVRRGGMTPHLEPKMAGTTDILLGVLALNHSSRLTARMAGLRRLWNGVRLSRKK